MPWVTVARAWLDVHWWVPLVVVAPLAAWALWHDVRRDPRLKDR